MDKVTKIRKHLQAAQDRQRSWADGKRRPLEFVIGDLVFLKISPTRGVIRFGSKGKLSPRYIGPFEVVKRIGAVAYKLALPPSLAGVHDVFHVSQLRKYVPDEKHILDYSELTLRPDLTYAVQPVAILDRREKVLKNKVISLVRVAWDPNSPGDSTWELEEEVREKYPYLFSDFQVSHYKDLTFYHLLQSKSLFQFRGRNFFIRWVEV